MIPPGTARLLLIAGFILTAGPVAAQAKDRWQLKLGEDEYVWDVRLLRLDGDSLIVSQGDSLIPVPVARISEVRLIQKSEMRLGEGGSPMNALTGADDEVYDLTPLDFAERIRAVQKILLYHPAEP